MSLLSGLNSPEALRKLQVSAVPLATWRWPQNCSLVLVLGCCWPVVLACACLESRLSPRSALQPIPAKLKCTAPVLASLEAEPHCLSIGLIHGATTHSGASGMRGLCAVRLEVGTETSVDHCKSIKTHLMQLFEASGDTDILVRALSVPTLLSLWDGIMWGCLRMSAAFELASAVEACMPQPYVVHTQGPMW